MPDNFEIIETLARGNGRLAEDIRILKAIKNLEMPIEVREALLKIINDK